MGGQQGVQRDVGTDGDWQIRRTLCKAGKHGLDVGTVAFPHHAARHIRRRVPGVSDEFAARLTSMGVEIRYNTPVNHIQSSENGVTLTTGSGEEPFDQVLVTTSPALMARMAPDLPESYLKGLLDLKSMGAVVLVVSLKHQLSREGYYWYNLPKTEGYPFLAMVEHTNFVSSEHFGGEHILYCGDYLELDHEYFKLSQEELVERFTPSFKSINPDYDPSWINQTWLFKTNYAQPIPMVNHSKNIPAIQTPLKGVFFASMSQVYPWDRGTNFAVEIARRAARQMIQSR